MTADSALTYMPNSFCSCCGHPLSDAEVIHDGLRCMNPPCRASKWGGYTFMSVPSVAVPIIPADPEIVGREHGVYTVRRGIPPFVGKLCLPGGFQIHNRFMKPPVQETWQQAAVREGGEEINVWADASGMKGHLTESTYNDQWFGDRNLIFGVAPFGAAVKPFVQSEEAQERVVLFPDSEEQLCFPIHRKALALYWDDLMLAHNVRR